MSLFVLRAKGSRRHYSERAGKKTHADNVFQGGLQHGNSTAKIAAWRDSSFQGSTCDTNHTHALMQIHTHTGRASYAAITTASQCQALTKSLNAWTCFAFNMAQHPQETFTGRKAHCDIFEAIHTCAGSATQLTCGTTCTHAHVHK